MMKRIMTVMVAIMMCTEALSMHVYAGEVGNQEALITENEEVAEETEPQMQASGSTTHYTMSVGDTKYLYTNAGNKAVRGAAWTSSDIRSVDILSQDSVSCRIKVKAYTSSIPVIIHCLYYYNELRNGYIYSRSDYTDYKITVRQPKSVTVHFETNGGNISTKSMSAEPGGVYGNLPTPSRYGYVFQGWYTENGSRVSSTTTVKNSDHTLYAQWIADAYTIKFNGNGCTGGKMADMTGCQTGIRYLLKANAFFRDGYFFSGWNTKANGSGTSYNDQAPVLNLAPVGGSVTLYATWKANAKDIAKSVVTLETDSYTYDGTAKRPQVTVRYADLVLTENEDYTVSYSENTNAGTAKAIIEGKNQYSGKITKDFAIHKASQNLTASLEKSSIQVGESAKITANGWGSLTFLPDKPSIATVSPEGQITGVSEGDAVITVHAAGDGNHNEATKTLSIHVGNAQTALSACKITLDVSDYTYDGTAKTPAVSVKDGQTALKKGSDYELSYSDNMHAGAASVTVRGKGIYSGTVTKTFVIHKAKQKVAVRIPSTQIAVGEAAVITASGYGALSYRSDNSGIADVDKSGTVRGVAAGSATITIKAAGDRDHQEGIEKLKVTVKADTEKLEMPLLKDVSNRSDGVVIRWNKVKNAERYYIYRKTGTEKWKCLGYVKNTACIDRKVSSGTSYTYTVLAANGSIRSDYDRKGLTAIYLSSPSISSLSNSSRGVTIAWKAVEGATRYSIYRGNIWIGTAYAGGAGSYTDSSARANGSKYTYKIYACNGNARSAVSPEKTIYYLRYPSILTLRRIYKQRFLFRWSRNASATGYEIAYCRNKNFSSGVTRKTIYSNRLTSMISPALSKGQTYYVRIRAYKRVSGIAYYSGWIQTSIKIN